MIAYFSGMDFLMAYWDMGEGFPACGPMWFVRNLLILVLLSFVIHFLMKEKRVGACVLLLMLVVPKSIAGLFYFSLGAWTAIHQIDFVHLCNKAGRYVVVPYLAVLTWKTVYIVNGGDDANMRIVMSLLAVMGIVVFVWLTSLCIRGRELSPAVRFLSASSFFVYAMHQAPLLMLCKLWVKVFPPMPALTILGYFLLPFVIIAICLAMYGLISRYMPRLLPIVTGGR